MMASRYHVRLHGRALKINEEVVRGDGIYEEIEDPEDKKRRLKRGDFSEEEEASLANAPPGTEQYQIAQKLRHEAEVNREFAQMYSGAVAQMRMQQQQQQATMMSHGLPQTQYQWFQQDPQALQTTQQQQSFSGPSRQYSPPTLQQSPAVSVAGAHHSSGASSAVMTPQQYHLALSANANVISPQTMVAGLEAGLSNATRYNSRSNSMPNEADASTGLFSSSDHVSPGPTTILTKPLPRHSFSSPHENGLYPGTPGLITNSSATSNSTPSVSTSTSQESEAYITAPHGNVQMPVLLESPLAPNPVIRQDSDGSLAPIPAYITDMVTAEDSTQASDQNAWLGSGSTMPYNLPATKGRQYAPLPLAQPGDSAWVTTYTQHAPILSTADAQAAAIPGYPPATVTLESDMSYSHPGSGTMPGPFPVSSRNLAVASELMKRQHSSRIGTPGGSAGDQWADWVQFSDEAI